MLLLLLRSNMYKLYIEQEKGFSWNFLSSCLWAKLRWEGKNATKFNFRYRKSWDWYYTATYWTVENITHYTAWETLLFFHIIQSSALENSTDNMEWVYTCIVFVLNQMHTINIRQSKSPINPLRLSKFINNKWQNPVITLNFDSLFCSFFLFRQVLDDFFFLGQETLFSAFAGLLRLWAASFSLVTE